MLGKELHRELEDVISDRKMIVARKGEPGFVRITVDGMECDGQVIQTIIAEGDAIGSVIVMVRDSSHKIGDIEQKAAAIAASFWANRWKVRAMGHKLAKSK